VIEFAGRGILLDIEGTTSSVRYVYDVMFPYARCELDAYLDRHWGEEPHNETCELIARDAGYDSLSAWAEATGEAPRVLVRNEIVRLMDGDVKATGLKRLQGQIWRAGFESGELQAHLFDDVPPALIRFNAEGRDVRIYSSGSVEAQRLFFGHTEYGNLLAQFGGHYDTTTGAKKESASYAAIASDFDLPAEEILFLSDVVAELDAAAAVGMQTGLAVRPDNAPVEPGHGHRELRNFSEVNLV